MKNNVKRNLINRINLKVCAYWDVDVDVVELKSDKENSIRFGIEWDDEMMDKDDVLEVLSIFLRKIGVLCFDGETPGGMKCFILDITDDKLK